MVEIVIEKSKEPRNKLKKRVIANCSSGEKNNIKIKKNKKVNE